jgi:chromosomal replication initiation ATPase DnaA
MKKEQIISKIIFDAERKIKQNTGIVVSLFCKTKEVNSDNELARIIVKLCAIEYDIPIETLIATTRYRLQCEARQVSMKIVRENTTLSLKEIGELYMAKKKGRVAELGKDHTTVIHGIKTIDSLLSYDKLVIEKYNRILTDFNKIINC